MNLKPPEPASRPSLTFLEHVLNSFKHCDELASPPSSLLYILQFRLSNQQTNPPTTQHNNCSVLLCTRLLYHTIARFPSIHSFSRIASAQSDQERDMIYDYNGSQILCTTIHIVCQKESGRRDLP